MKKNQHLFLAAVLCAGILLFAACTKDYTPKKETESSVETSEETTIEQEKTESSAETSEETTVSDNQNWSKPY